MIGWYRQPLCMPILHKPWSYIAPNQAMHKVSDTARVSTGVSLYFGLLNKLLIGKVLSATLHMVFVSVASAMQAFLDAAKPVTAVVLAHNGMNRALQQIQAFHPRLHFAALSPHVAAAARHALHIHTHWLLPTFTFTGKVSS